MAVNLYEIKVGDEFYRYTSGEFDVETAIHVYKAVPISRDEITRDLKNENLKITAAASVEPFSNWKQYTPTVRAEVVIYQYPTMLKLASGVITTFSFNAKDGTVSISLEQEYGSKNTKIPTRQFSKSCGFNLFDRNCGVNQEDYKLEIPAGEYEISGTAITSDLIPNDGNYVNGYVMASSGEAQFITSQVDGAIYTISPLFFGDGTEQSLVLYYGCNKSIGDCSAKFGNSENYGGFPFIPTINPATEGI